MDLARYDLNLLVALRALLEERNVTRAGERLGITQPAASNALARLRRQFGDELLVRRGQAMELTPLAASLLDMVSATLSLAERTYDVVQEFDPATSIRRFSVRGSDYALSLLAAPLRRLEEVAPGIRLQLGAVRGEHLHDPEVLLRRVDLLVVPKAWLPGFPSLPLAADDWVGVVDRDRGPAGDRLTLEDLGRLPMVGLFDDPSNAGSHIKRQLEVLGITLAIRVSVESFFEVPLLVEHTGRIGLLPRRFAEKAARSARIRSVELPVPTAALQEEAFWHPLAESDPGHRWLRSLLTG
ncbi:LysR family transcriptional regulator [Actinocorallia populi]|uniref:LysR family transcriptional regulator n=1 Tax=Actinocorallia populi TaxID=2079200 RepID=UPI0018E5815B|nr:LysR family transcriptional regulator [Actinocorallia populi]